MTVSLEQAQLSLSELIARTSRGEKVIITQDQKPVAELRPVAMVAPLPLFGSCKEMLTILSDDDEHLDDFQEYMK